MKIIIQTGVVTNACADDIVYFQFNYRNTSNTVSVRLPVFDYF